MPSPRQLHPPLLAALLATLPATACTDLGDFTTAYTPSPRNARHKPIPAPGFNPHRKLIRRVHTGMTTNQVFDRLGAPERLVNIGSGRQKWRYGHPSRLQLELLFVDGRLRSWTLD